MAPEDVVVPRAPVVVGAGTWPRYSVPRGRGSRVRRMLEQNQSPPPPHYQNVGLWDSHILRGLDGLFAVLQIFFGISGLVGNDKGRESGSSPTPARAPEVLFTPSWSLPFFYAT